MMSGARTSGEALAPLVALFRYSIIKEVRRTLRPYRAPVLRTSLPRGHFPENGFRLAIPRSIHEKLILLFGRGVDGGKNPWSHAAQVVPKDLWQRVSRFSIESPTLPLGNGQMLRDTSFLARGPDRVYIGVGTTELAVPQGEKFAAQLRMPLPVANAGFAKMAEVLAGNFRAAYINRPEVMLVVEPNANHTSASWARRFPQAVTMLYGVRMAPDHSSPHGQDGERPDARH